ASHLAGDTLQDAVLLCRQHPSADPGKSLALSPRGRLLEGSGRADVDTRRSKPRTSESAHCRLRLWLLPPLPWNRPPSGEGSALAHDREQRIRRFPYADQTLWEMQIRRVCESMFLRTNYLPVGELWRSISGFVRSIAHG